MTKMKVALSILAFSVSLGRNFQLHLSDGGCFLMNCAAKGDPLVPPKLSWKTYQRKCPKHRGLKGSLLSASPIPHAASVLGLRIQSCHHLWSQGRFVITHHLSNRALCWISGDAENPLLVKDGFYSNPFL